MGTENLVKAVGKGTLIIETKKRKEIYKRGNTSVKII